MSALGCARVEWLEPARPGRRPPLDDDLLLREELHGISALAVQISEEAVARSAERKERHRGGDGDVDADVADFRLVPELSRVCSARREETRLIAVRAAVDERDGFVDRPDVVCESTGPKISVVVSSLWNGRPSMTVGPTEFPGVGGAFELPAVCHRTRPRRPPDRSPS